MFSQISSNNLVVGSCYLFLLYAAGVANGFSPRATTFSKATLPSQQYRTALSAILEVSAEKPLGIVLEENEENMAKGVFCAECAEDSSGFTAGIRNGDVITVVDGTETSDFTFEQVMGLLQQAESPVAISLERKEVDETEVAPTIERKAAKISPKRMPSAKKLAKASTSATLWKDPLMIGSAAFTVLFPLGIYLASKIGKS